MVVDLYGFCILNGATSHDQISVREDFFTSVV
jgi:hypothetical protein